MKLKRNKEIDKIICDFVTKSYQLNNLHFSKINFNSRYEHADLYGILKDKDLIDFVLVNISRCRIFRKRTNLAAVGYVCSEKIDDNLKNVFKEVFTDLHKADIPIANLNSKNNKFYSSIGFENTVFQKEFKFNSEYLETYTNDQGNTKVGSWDDLIIQNGAVQLYEVPMHSDDERNTLNRAYWWWNMLDKAYKNMKLAVYFGRVGLPVSYMLFKVNEEKSEVDILEMYAQKAEGLHGIMNFVKKAFPADQITITMPEVSHLEHLISLQNQVNITLKPTTMSRIIDVKSVLEAIKLKEDGSFVLNVTNDGLCPWNIGCWKVIQEDGKMTVKKTEDQPDFTADINSWTKVLIGNLPLNQAIKFGTVKQNNKNNVIIEKGKVTFLDNY